MPKIFYIIKICLITIFLFCNCQKEKAGIAFTFDDNSIDEWYNQCALFKEYDIRATFFITRPYLLDSNQINKLKILKSDGHEIGCHGYYHKNATDYQTPEDYINQEIKPALQKLQELGFTVTSFAYPFGASTSELDSALLNYFKIIRKATYNYLNTTIDQYPEIYANSNNYRTVNAMGIDCNYVISPENFETGMQRALKNNEILIVYAHSIDTSNSDYSIHPEYLEELFLICKKRGIKSVTMNELFHFF
ncbi:MAG: polysaccharide deacetylase family protein [Lentimicrobiaceae bacterium]|nr:polysaccharide deacetylase family protein [Lentimicrobiaceae bacterium]